MHGRALRTQHLTGVPLGGPLGGAPSPPFHGRQRRRETPTRSRRGEASVCAACTPHLLAAAPAGISWEALPESGCGTAKVTWDPAVKHAVTALALG